MQRIFVVGALCALAPQLRAQTYWPGPQRDWERRTPEELGFDPDALDAAVAFSIASESEAPRDLERNHQRTFGREPHGEAVGPFGVRGPQTGLILRRGYLVAEWGEPARVEQTFSVAKSFLSTVAGIAFDQGLLRLADPVRDSVPPLLLADGDGEPGDLAGRRPKLLFESQHNRTITWEHLLRQTSDWEGTLWGKPEWADRPDRDPTTWETRARHPSGTVFEYNDTRVNLLALALTTVFRRPLAEVLHEHVMGPVDASTTWQWHGYENSWLDLQGSKVQVVSGGSHWGGGMFVNTYDLARLGLLALHRGVWKDRRIFSEEWFEHSTTPGPANAGYGFMNYYLNRGDQGFAAAPENSFQFLGAGSNIVFVDPDHELVMVTRWLRSDRADSLVERVLASLVVGPDDH